MKKMKLLVAVAMVGLLGACGTTNQSDKGDAKQQTSTKSKVAEVSIEDGTYIDPIGGDTEEDQDVIALTVKVKNNSKDKFFVFDESFYLVEKGNDEKIKSLRLDYESRLKDFSGEISPGKSLSGTVVFEVEKGKKYQLVFSSNGYDDDGKSHDDVEMALDLKAYESTKKALKEPTKALQAYVDVVLLQKDNEDYEKLVANDSKADIEMVKKEYNNMLKDTFYSYRLTDDESAKAFEDYVANQREAVELKLKPAGNVGERARVEVDYKGISEQAVSDLIRDAKDEYDEKNKDYDSAKREQYAVSKLADIYAEAEVGEPRNDLFVSMVKKDDKWSIDFKSDDSYQNKALLRAFLGQVD